jgi:hypothetical protein
VSSGLDLTEGGAGRAEAHHIMQTKAIVVAIGPFEIVLRGEKQRRQREGSRGDRERQREGRRGDREREAEETERGKQCERRQGGGSREDWSRLTIRDQAK